MNINPATGTPITLAQIRALHPEKTIGTNADLVALGYPELEDVARPADQPGYIIGEGQPEEYEPGKWRQTWTQTPKDLEVYRAEKHAERKDAVLVAKYSTFKHDEYTYDCDKDSVQLLAEFTALANHAIKDGTQEALKAYSALLGDGWRDDNGVPRITTAGGILAISNSLAAHIRKVDDAGQIKKSAIDAANSVDELSAIDFDITLAD